MRPMSLWESGESSGEVSLADRIDTVRMKPPAFKMVLTATGEFAYTRPDGVIVSPLSALRP